MNIITSDNKNIYSQLSFFGEKEPPHCYSGKTQNIPANSFKRDNPESVTIRNFHTIDKFVSRGGQPTEQQIAELKRNGYTDIISFSLEFDETAP